MNDNKKIIWRFIENIESELEKPKISEATYETLKRYYSNWVKKDSLIRKYYYVERVEPLVNLIKSSNRKLKIMDIGCGCGSEAIFCSSLGAHVLGIDLNKNRINCAKYRKSYYENLLNKKIDVKFKLQNIFKYKEKDKFDIIWIMESIHHIEPVLKVLEFCYNLLNSDGRIIICDPNGLNPLIQIVLFFKRGLKLHKKVFDPEDNQEIAYGNENIFTSFGIVKMLRKKGFKIEEISYQRFLPLFYTGR